MKILYKWNNNGVKLTPHFDFVFLAENKNEIIKCVNNEIISVLDYSAISEKIFTPPIALLAALPLNLRKIIILELKFFENNIESISYGNWPTNGSIVVRLKNLFNDKSKEFSKNILWRNLQDPHYCREEILEIENNISYILIS